MITNKKTFTLGVLLAIGFAAVFAVIMSPIFGDGKNGLVYADDMFNSLSKGSAYFIAEEVPKVEKMAGTGIDVQIKAADESQAQTWNTLYSTAGAMVTVAGTDVSIKGDLGNILKTVLADTDALYHNQSGIFNDKYNMGGREATYAWYTSLNKMDEALKVQQHFAESTTVSGVIKKAVEPSYNYYGIEIKKVADYKAIVTALMVFYLIYTLWWGFAIYLICDGVGITMTKAAKKVEA